jgi:hypothetical protein
MGIYSDPHRKSKKEATKYYFVNGSTALLYLYPNKKSEIISSVPYGEILTIDSTAISDVSKNWIPLVTNSKLSGFVLRGEVIPIDQKKRFSIIKKDIQEKFTDPRNRKDIVLWKQITNFLFTSSENGNFTGEEYVFFRVFSGESLSNALFAIQSDGLTNWEIKHQDFVAKYKQYLTKDSDTSYMRLDENFFWKYASLNENSRYAEIAANLALKNSPKIDCKGEPICYLIDLNNTKVRYLRFFSKSKNLKKMSNQIILALEEFTSG